MDGAQRGLVEQTGEMPDDTHTPRSTAALLGRGLLLFGLTAALLVAYYWVHKPIDLGAALRLGGALLDLATVALVLAAAGGLGRLALGRFPALALDGLSRGERLACHGLIGLGGLSLVLLGLGMIGLLARGVLWAGLALIVVVGRREIAAWLVDLRDLLRSVRFDSAWQRAAALGLGGLLALALLTALAMPFHWDGLTYHLVGPARYLAAGRIAPQPDNFYLGFPQGVELLYTLTLSLFGRDTTAAPLHFGIGLLGVLALTGMLRRRAGVGAAWAAALLLFSAYNLWALFGWAYVDLAVFAYGALGVSAALEWRDRGGRAWLILVGVVIGLATGVKYTAAAPALGLGLFIAVQRPRRVVQHGLVVGAAAALTFAPWMLRGLLHYGNPIYPFVFGGLNWDALRAESFSFAHYSLVATGQAWHLPILPVAATVFGQDRAGGYGFSAGAWLLTLWLALPFVWPYLDGRGRRLGRDLVVMLAAPLVFWAINAAGSPVGQQVRLMTGVLPLFAGAGALTLVGLAAWPRKPLDVRFILFALFGLTFVLNALDAAQTVAREKTLPYLFGQIDAGEFMYTNTGAYYGAAQNLATLPAGSQVRLMWEPRAYSCPPTVTCVPDVAFDHWSRPLTLGESPDDIFAGYRAAGDDYLLFFESGFEDHLIVSTFADQGRQFPAALEHHMTPIWTDGIRYTLYAWRDPA